MSYGHGFFFVSTPFHLVVAAAAVGVVDQEVASMRLKIGQQVAYGQARLATRAFWVCQNPYGFGAI